MRLFFMVSSNSTLPSTTSCIRSLSDDTMVTLRAGLAPQPGIGGDQVIGLIALHLDTGDAEGAGGIAHQGKLRDQIFRRGGRWALYSL